jgi:protein gp37
MGKETEISWTHHTFNPWIGCQKVSPACANCYAERETFVRIERSKGRELWGPNADRHRTSESNWKQPLSWDRAAKKAGERRRVFCASLADVFEDHPAIWPGWRADLGKMILDTPNLDWLLLTKRPENIYRMLPDFWINFTRPYGLPKNVWLGTTVENQEMADKRIPELLKIDASARFLSCEPLLSPVDLSAFLGDRSCMNCGWRGFESDLLEGLEPCPRCYGEHNPETGDFCIAEEGHGGIDWVIGGGESGPGARFCPSDYARRLRDQCADAGVPFHWKQWGEFLPDDQNPQVGAGRGGIKVGKKKAGRLLDGVEHNEFPAILPPVLAGESNRKE